MAGGATTSKALNSLLIRWKEQFHYIEYMKPQVLAFSFLLLASAATAMTPPPIPPDPAAVEAARKLVEQLYSGGVSPSFASGPMVGEDTAKSSVAWVDETDPELLKDGEFKSLFVEKVTEEAKSLAPTCVPEAKEALAQSFARRLSPADAKGITSFLTTESGQALPRLISTEVFWNALSRCVYRGIFPSLPRILDSARESNAIRQSVNSSVQRER